MDCQTRKYLKKLGLQMWAKNIKNICWRNKLPNWLIYVNISKRKVLNWPKKFMKTDLSTAIFSDQCKSRLDWSEKFGRFSVVFIEIVNVSKKYQLGGGVMFWPSIVGIKIIGHIKSDYGIKIM